MKFVLILYLCSMLNGSCSSSHVPGYSFDTHYDCVFSGYGISQKVFKALEEDEEDFTREYINNKRMVVKFECKALPEEKIIIPKPKPKVGA